MKTYDVLRTRDSVNVVGAQHETHFSAEKGFSITSEGPTVVIAKGESAAEVPWSNVLFAKPKKAAKK